MHNYNWSKITDELLENLVITQAELAERCKVTQQSISNWKNDLRTPGVYARHKLKELLAECDLCIEDFTTVISNKTVSIDDKDGITKIPEDTLKFAFALGQQPLKKRKEVIELGYFIMERD